MNQTKEHYKLYKDGKSLVTVRIGMMSAIAGLGILTMTVPISANTADNNYAAEDTMLPASKVSTIAANNSYVAEQSNHFKTSNMKFVDEHGKALAGNVDLGDTTAVGIGMSFDFTASDLKRGDRITIPVKIKPTDKIVDNSAFTGGIGLTDAGNRFKVISSGEQGVVLEAMQDVTEANGSFTFGARIGNSRSGLFSQVKPDLSGYEIKPLNITYNGKQIAHITSSLDTYMVSSDHIVTGTDMQFIGKSMNTPMYIQGHNTLGKDSINKSSKEMGVDDLIMSETAHVKNDTVTGFNRIDIGGWISIPDNTGNSYFPQNIFIDKDDNSIKGNRIADIGRDWKQIQMPDGLTENQVRDRLKVEMTKDKSKTYYGYSISKDGHDVALAYDIGDLFDMKKQVKLSDTPYYKEIGATSPHDYFEKITGGKYSPEVAKYIDETYEKHPMHFSIYANFSVADPAVDHEAHVDLHTSLGDQSRDFNGHGIKIAVEGQSLVKTRYVDENGKNISDVVTDPGWPKGSEKNKDGHDKATSHPKFIEGYILTKNGEDIAWKPEDIKSDYPEEGKTTTFTYHYRKAGKFVTKEAGVKVPAYSVNKKDYTIIDIDYTIPFKQGKKAQDADGHDLKLIDPNDKTKGYHSPEIKDMFKDTEVKYVNANAQITVNHIDMTNNKVIQTQTEKGTLDDAAKMNTNQVKESLMAKGYILKKSDVPAKLVFNKESMTYNMYYDHASEEHSVKSPNGADKDNLQSSVNRTITYVDETGKEVFPKHIEQLNFERSYETDKVTGKVIKDNGWHTSKNHFDSVKSPDMKGYVADIAEVGGESNVGPDDSDINVKVVYKKGAQLGSMSYIDKTTGKLIEKRNLTGKTGDKSDYTPKMNNDKLESLYAKGYKLVTDGYPKTGIVFDNDPQTNQDYATYLAHDYAQVDKDHPGKPGQLIDPKLPNAGKWRDGSDQVTMKKTRKIEAHFEGHEDKNKTVDEVTSTSSRVGTVDKVNGTIKWEAWPKFDSFKEFKSPDVEGWKPDKESIKEMSVDEKTPDLTTEIIEYTQDEPAPKKEEVKEEPKKEEPKKEEPKKEEPKKETPDKEEPKQEESAKAQPQQSQPEQEKPQTGTVTKTETKEAPTALGKTAKERQSNMQKIGAVVSSIIIAIGLGFLIKKH